MPIAAPLCSIAAEGCFAFLQLLWISALLLCILRGICHGGTHKPVYCRHVLSCRAFLRGDEGHESLYCRHICNCRILHRTSYCWHWSDCRWRTTIDICCFTVGRPTLAAIYCNGHRLIYCRHCRTCRPFLSFRGMPSITAGITAPAASGIRYITVGRAEPTALRHYPYYCWHTGICCLILLSDIQIITVGTRLIAAGHYTNYCRHPNPYRRTHASY